MALNQNWLKLNVGKPSSRGYGQAAFDRLTGKGSKYRDIYNLTGTFHNAPMGSTAKFGHGLKLLRLLDAWSYSKHTGAKTVAERQEKDRQQKWLNVFERELKVALQAEFTGGNFITRLSATQRTSFDVEEERDKVRVLLHEMKTMTDPLLRNTAKNLMANVDTMETCKGRDRGEYKSGKLYISPNVFANKSQGMGTLVHECHHKLSPMPSHMSSSGNAYEHKYIDEFCAHWKESMITRPGNNWNRSEWVNNKVKLYTSQYEKWVSKYKEMTDIEQAGMLKVEGNESLLTVADLATAPTLDEMERLGLIHRK